MIVVPMAAQDAREIVEREHYLHRKPSVCCAFALVADEDVKGVVTFGVPASRDLAVGACRSDPRLVVELNRLWVADDMPRNTESWFLSRALGLMEPRIVVSFADTGRGHQGYVYRAANFSYAGWSDMERTFPRYDYRRPDQAGHSRDAFRDGRKVADGGFVKVPRSMKVRYWITTGNRTERRALAALCTWPSMSWLTEPPPTAWQSLREYRAAAS